MAANRVTQAAVLAVTGVNAAPEAQITQAALICVVRAGQGSMVAQAAVLALTIPKPLPKPLPLLPDEPVTEAWIWRTSVLISEVGREERLSLAQEPRIRLRFKSTLPGERERLAAANLIWRNLGDTYYYPLYQYMTTPTVGAVIGATRLYFDVDKTDIRDGEAIGILDPRTNETHVYEVANMETDGATLAKPLEINVPTNFRLAPALIFRFDTPSVGYEMNALTGSISLTLLSHTTRSVERSGMASFPTMLDGLPLLADRPLADGGVEDTFQQNIDWDDRSLAPAYSANKWRWPKIVTDRQYLVMRPEGMDYWRAFAKLVQGRQNTFLVPSFRNDLPPLTKPALGATVIVTSNFHFFDLHRSRAFVYVRIQSRAGVIYRQIINVSANYNSLGDAVSANIQLNSSIGNGAGANEDLVISFVNTCRLETDEIIFEHSHSHSVARIRVRTVEK